MKLIRCPRCGKVYSTLSEANTRSLGLALIATCAKCGKRWGVTELWRKVKEVTVEVYHRCNVSGTGAAPGYEAQAGRE